MDHPAADQAADLVLGDVLSCEHAKHAWRLRSLRRVDLGDLGMRMWAAHEIAVDLSFEVDVVSVPALAGNESMVFLALDSCANARLAHPASPIVPVEFGTALHARSAVLNGLDDVVVARAAADIALELVADCRLI